MNHTKQLAVFDPCTDFEHKNGDLHKLLESYLSIVPSQDFKFDWFFCFNKGPIENYEDLLIYESHPNINKIYLIDEKIPKEEDVYIRQHIIEFEKGSIKYIESEKPEDLPILGGASGPNLGFYRAIDLVFNSYDHEFFFMVEHDSHPIKKHWFDHMIEYINKEKFLIAGSKYKGHQPWHYVLNYKDHLNGIAIYKNDKMLIEFVKECESYNKRSINEKNWCINFDILLNEFSKTNQGKNIIKHDSPFLNTDFITNISDPNDYHISHENLLRHHPNTIIIHQKEYKQLESFRERYQAGEFNYLTDKKRMDKSCMFLLRQPRTAGNWLIKSITSTLSIENNSINLEYPIPYCLKIRLPQEEEGFFITCDFFFLSKKLIKNFKRGFKKTKATIEAKDFKSVYKDIKHFIRPILISNDPFDYNSNARSILRYFNDFDYNLDCYAILRQPFDKTKSLYTENLKSGTNSKDSFIDFLNSNKIPDSFIIRSLTNLNLSEEVEFFHYEEALQILKQFDVFDLSQANDMLIHSFNKTFNLDYEARDFHVDNSYALNSQHLVTLQEEDLKNYKYESNNSINLSEFVKGRTFFDQLIYDSLIKQTEDISLFYKNRSVKNNLFDFELSKRDLTIATFISANNQSKKLLDDWRASWLAKGFKILIGSEEEVKDSQLLSTIKHDFLEQLCIGREISGEELESFKKLILIAELDAKEPLYFSDIYLLNKSFELWEPDSIFHLMNKSLFSFFSGNSSQARNLIELLLTKKHKIKNQTASNKNFMFTLSNVCNILIDDLRLTSWIRTTDLDTLNLNFINDVRSTLNQADRQIDN